MEPEIQGNKEVTISLANAVAKENNRGSVRAAQKAGRSAPQLRVTTARITTRAKGKGRNKGKGRVTKAVNEVEEVEEVEGVEGVEGVEVIDNTSTGAIEAFSGSRGRKRKAADTNAGYSLIEPVRGPRKLRKRI
jgi:hypothetical protein